MLRSTPLNCVEEIRSSVVAMPHLREYSQTDMNDKFSIVRPFQFLLAVDGSEHSMAAVQMLSDLPVPPGSTITIMGVFPIGQPPDGTALQAAMEHAETIFSKNEIETESVFLYGHVAKELIEYGRKHRPDLMVIGAKGLHATLQVFWGGVAQQVVEYARWPVLVVRSPYRGLRRVLLATDGSQSSRLAAQYLTRFPLPEQTEVQTLHVQAIPAETRVFTHGMGLGPIAYFAPSLSIPADLPFVSYQAEINKQKGRAALTEAKRILETTGRKPRGFITDGDPATQILAHSERQGVDLIVSGSHGRSTMERWWRGSVSRNLLHYAHSSVLFVRTDPENKK